MLGDEFPKSLYLEGWDDLSKTVVVRDSDEEFEWRKQGYKMLSETEVTEVGEPRKRGRPKKVESDQDAHETESNTEGEA